VVSLPVTVQEIYNGHSYYNMDERNKRPTGVNQQKFKVVLVGEPQMFGLCNSSPLDFILTFISRVWLT